MIITIEVLKKNRVYFACKKNGYDCKLKIDSTSENLELGTHDLEVDDISVRTKYGTDVIYQVKKVFEKSEGIVTLKHHAYNEYLVKKCRELNGKWDAENKAWVFPSILQDHVEELDFLFNSDLVHVELKAKDELNAHTGPLTFCGYKLAEAHGRDSGAKVSEHASMTSGKIYSSGSMKNWYTTCDPGTTFIIKCSKNLINAYKQEGFEIKIFGE